MSRVSHGIRVKLTGLTALVRHQRGATPVSQRMDAILVRPVGMKTKAMKKPMKPGDGPMPMPPHFPTLIAPKGAVRIEPADLFSPPKAGTVKVPSGCDAWLIESFELRFPGAPRRAHPVTHVPDALTQPAGSVAPGDLDRLAPLCTIGNVSEAGGSHLDGRWLGPVQYDKSPVGARVRLSGGKLCCEAKKTPDVPLPWFWELKSTGRAFAGRPLAEVMALTYKVPTGQCEVKLDVVRLSDETVVGAVYLRKVPIEPTCQCEIEIRNFPAPKEMKPMRDSKGFPLPLHHFGAFYDLLKVPPPQRPIPYYWGARVSGVMRKGRAAGAAAQPTLMLASEGSPIVIRTDVGTCPNGSVTI